MLSLLDHEDRTLLSFIDLLPMTSISHILRRLGIPFLLFALFGVQAYSQETSIQVTQPSEYLGYNLGERFTPHHKVIGYFEHVAKQSNRVSYHTYGSTYEGRDLVYVVVTSLTNHEVLEEIRTNNLKLSGLQEGEPTATQRAITWLSYNVHGDEASSSEAAMKTLFELATSQDSDLQQWLDASVIIMDPMLNPDGRDRYVAFVTQQTGMNPNSNGYAQEHDQPWPRGRANHYLFDLNRDWAWGIQKESRHRIEAYHQWMPHIHVDFHEQGFTSPYYFAPAAEPYPPAITPWQRSFQQTIGAYNMAAFDQRGWHYFTREVFDLFYPSYGDTWPTFNGSIGMTYEQAGGGYAGLSISLPQGGELTLADRLLHHHTTGLATIEAVAENADRIVDEFSSQAQLSMSQPRGTYGSYIIPQGQLKDKMHALTTFLEAQGIIFGMADINRSLDGYNYALGAERRVRVESGDLVIPAVQPKGQLVSVLFDPRPGLSDSMTYDITSWEMPYRYGLEAVAIRPALRLSQTQQASDYEPKGGVKVTQNGLATLTEPLSEPFDPTEKPYAYVLPWSSLQDAKFLADWFEAGGHVQVSMNPFTIGETSFPRGSLVITREYNPAMIDRFDSTLYSLAETHGRTLFVTSSGAVTTGSDFGASSMELVMAPKVGVISRDVTSSLSLGEVWHYMDQQLGYPSALIPGANISADVLSELDVLVMPSGDYRGFSESQINAVHEWIQGGGRLVAIGTSLRALERSDLFGITSSSASNPSEDSEQEDPLATSYEDQNRSRVSSFNPGSVYKIRLDDTHPLAFGYSDHMYVMNISNQAYEPLSNGTIGLIDPSSHMSGFIGGEAKRAFEGSMAIGRESIGPGEVIYLPINPLFRGFWEESKLLVANALFLGGL